MGSILAALALANAVLFGLRRSLSEERAVLADAASALSRDASKARALRETEQSLVALVAQGRETMSAPAGIGELRDLLLGAEEGLQVERISLEYRPEERLQTGLGGGRVDASLRGSFEAIYQYLERVEGTFLPLSAESLTLRRDGSYVALEVQWTVRWPIEKDVPVASDVALPPAELSQLSLWLSQEPPPLPKRNLFAFLSDEAQESVQVAVAPRIVEQPPTLEAAPERPVLTGFVLARPELEPDVRRRVLAALRYAGEVHLLMVGETIGGYRIESMEARDSVTLQDAKTGERLRLTLDN